MSGSKDSIYILQLTGGRYYVGKTNNIARRYQEHLNGEGSAWTRRWPPTTLVKTIDATSAFDEDKTVKEYMAKYGIDKVRGGSYVAETLDAAQHDLLTKEIRGAEGRCTQCGGAGHFVATCTRASPSAQTYVRSVPSKSSGSGFGSDVGSRFGSCYRCGRKGHYSNNCYARTDSEGYELESESDDDEDEDEDEYDSDESY